MSELGRLLYEARTAKQLSLADIEAVTRIRQRYLEALENGDYASLPRGTVARGFVRTYAAYLGLDVEGLGEGLRDVLLHLLELALVVEALHGHLVPSGISLVKEGCYA